jgi:spore coat protein A
MSLTRRDALKLGLLGSAAVALPLERVVTAKSANAARIATSRLPKAFTVPFTIPQPAIPHRTDATTDYYRMEMRPAQAEILPGLKTTIWGYNGTFPGPTVLVNQGRETVIRHVNALPATHPTLKYTPWTSVHLHGSASDPQYDGYAADITNPGQWKDYHYPNKQPARTLWYHDHGVHHTAENVGMGLAAQYHLHDPIEQALPIPHGEFEVPLIISDAMFNADGSFLFDHHSESGMYGDVILINGRPWPTMKVKRRKYRFRFLNASVSRSYSFYLGNGDAFTIIGTDAGLMSRPQTVREFRMGMAERYEVVIDFAKYGIGQRVVLKNHSPQNNIDYAGIENIMAFDIVADPTEAEKKNNTIPDQLVDSHPMTLEPQAGMKTRRFEFIRKNGTWTINGHTWDDIVQSQFRMVDANPQNGDTEIWELVNKSGGWFHPVHIHLIDFRILDRNGKPPFAWELGPKDVAYVGENETVRVIAKFEGRGKYMMHCHNLVHEDHDMMTQFEVLDPAGESDPLGDLCKDMPDPDDL